MPTRAESIAGPSPRARASGRYPKRRLKFAGFDVSIENEPGTARPKEGDRESPHAQTLIPYAYGYFDGTKGADGDEVDVFLGGDESSALAWIISARRPTGGFDEHKVMLGFHSKEEAEAAFRLAYHDGAGWRMGATREIALDDLRAWLAQRRTKSTVARDRLVFVEFPARIEKQLHHSESGEPILRMLASGTKLDSTRYDYRGVEVVGEKVMPELLATMAAEAKAGGVYMLESHPTTLRMGQSVGAEIVELPDGDQELYVDFLLNTENPLVPFLLKEIEAGDYIPQCSIGLLVRRIVNWDEEENGYVGQLVEGHFEHVALTRPEHNAYPDAQLERVFLSGDSLASAWKSLVESTAAEIDDVEAEEDRVVEDAIVETMKSVLVRAGVEVGKGAYTEEALRVASRVVKAQRDPTSVQTLLFDKKKFSPSEARAWATEHDFTASKIDETETTLRIRQQEPASFKPNSFRTIRLTDGVQAVIGRKKDNAADKSATGREGEPMNVRIRKSDPAAAAVADPAKVAVTKEDEGARKEDAKEDVKEDAKAAPAAPPPAAPPAKKDDAKEDEDGKAPPPPPPPAKKPDGEDDAPPEEKKKAKGATLKDLAEHLHDLTNMAKEGGEGTDGDLRELLQDMAADLEMACEIADAHAGVADEAKEDAKEDEGGDTKEDAKENEDRKEDAKENEDRKEDAKGEGLVVKVKIDAERAARELRRVTRKFTRTLKGFESRTKALEDQIASLSKEPATIAARRYSDGPVDGKTGADARPVDEILGGILEIVKELKDPREKDVITRRIAAEYVAKHWAGTFTPKA